MTLDSLPYSETTEKVVDDFTIKYFWFGPNIYLHVVQTKGLNTMIFSFFVDDENKFSDESTEEDIYLVTKVLLSKHGYQPIN